MKCHNNKLFNFCTLINISLQHNGTNYQKCYKKLQQDQKSAELNKTRRKVSENFTFGHSNMEFNELMKTKVR